MGPLDGEVVVADAGHIPVFRIVHIVEVHAAREAVFAVHNQQLAVVAQVELELALDGVDLRETDELEVGNVAVAAEEAGQARLGRAELVVEHPHPQTLAGAFGQGIKERTPHPVVADDVALEVDVALGLADGLQHGGVGLLAIGVGGDGVAAEERVGRVETVEHPVELHIGGVIRMGQHGVLETAPVGQRLRLRLAAAPRRQEGLVGALLLPPLGGEAVDAEGEVDQGAEEGHRPGQIDPQQGRARLARLARLAQTVQGDAQGDDHMRQRADSDRRPAKGQSQGHRG